MEVVAANRKTIVQPKMQSPNALTQAVWVNCSENAPLVNTMAAPARAAQQKINNPNVSTRAVWVNCLENAPLVNTVAVPARAAQPEINSPCVTTNKSAKVKTENAPLANIVAVPARAVQRAFYSLSVERNKSARARTKNAQLVNTAAVHARAAQSQWTLRSATFVVARAVTVNECECWDFEPDIPKPNFQSSIEFSEDLSDVTPSSYSYGGDDPLKCLNLSWGVKRDDLKKNVIDWCKSVNGKKVTKTGDTDVLYKRFSLDESISYWLGARYDGESGGNCGDSADVREINCVSTMLDEIEDCNSGDPDFKGAERTDGCVKYHISLSQSTNDLDPPFKPLPLVLPKCERRPEDVTVLLSTFWRGVSKKFCKDVGDGKSSKKAELRITDAEKRDIFKAAPPPNPDNPYLKDWKFHFEWEPKGSGSCIKDCDQAMSSIANSCIAGTNMVKQGSFDVGCGNYRYSLEGSPMSRPEPPKPSPTPPPPPNPVKKCGCEWSFWFLRCWIDFEIGVIPGDGAAFKEQIKGCGATTGWEVTQYIYPPYSPPHYTQVIFNLPLTLKPGCVERAIKTITSRQDFECRY
ncbi:hypothetical protein B0J11DRAFT_512975 [Dendryphion nanum]|uniref:Uncharacterized protein n=1 Tax=Dendryphion nanum TaxID=256645 RepID=A0A9P9CY75_9PLEO|nr:hypothetical protein B0J11DRAFT_512975 [Dendryphion nanum]